MSYNTYAFVVLPNAVVTAVLAQLKIVLLFRRIIIIVCVLFDIQFKLVSMFLEKVISKYNKIMTVHTRM